MAKPALHRDESLQVPWERTSRKKTNITKAKSRRPTGLGAPLSWNSSHSIFTFLFIFNVFNFCFQSAGRLHFCACLCGIFHSWLKFGFGHRSYSACWMQRRKKKSSYPQVSVQLPPTSQPLIKTKITNNNNNKNQEIGKKVKKGNKTRNRKTESESVVRLGELTVV